MHKYVWIAAACALVTASGCGKKETATAKVGPAGVVVPGLKKPLSLPQAETKPGTAVMILVDTSGSMGQMVKDVDGKERPKYQIARTALERIVQQTAKWKQAHPDRPLYVGLGNFNSSVGIILPVSEFDEARLKESLNQLPRPNSGTAIGGALERAAQELYRSGVARKHIVCITDGENTTGLKPDVIARQLFAQTDGGIGFNFIAFDTSADHFKFLESVKGYLTQASDGAQLQAELTKIYDKRILVEAEEPPPG